MAESDPRMGYVILTKFQKKLKEGSGRVGPDGKMAKAVWEHQPVLLNAAHIVAVEKITVVDEQDKTSMAQATSIKMFGMAEVLVLEPLDDISKLIESAGFAVQKIK